MLANVQVIKQEELNKELKIATNDSKEFKFIRDQVFYRADMKEDQKELAGEAYAFYYQEDDGVLTELWAVHTISPEAPARSII